MGQVRGLTMRVVFLFILLVVTLLVSCTAVQLRNIEVPATHPPVCLPKLTRCVFVQA